LSKCERPPFDRLRGSAEGGIRLPKSDTHFSSRQFRQYPLVLDFAVEVGEHAERGTIVVSLDEPDQPE